MVHTRDIRVSPKNGPSSYTHPSPSPHSFPNLSTAELHEQLDTGLDDIDGWSEESEDIEIYKCTRPLRVKKKKINFTTGRVVTSKRAQFYLSRSSLTYAQTADTDTQPSRGLAPLFHSRPPLPNHLPSSVTLAPLDPFLHTHTFPNSFLFSLPHHLHLLCQASTLLLLFWQPSVLLDHHHSISVLVGLRATTLSVRVPLPLFPLHRHLSRAPFQTCTSTTPIIHHQHVHTSKNASLRFLDPRSHLPLHLAKPLNSWVLFHQQPSQKVVQGNMPLLRSGLGNTSGPCRMQL